jgi:hypothetical protein
MSTCETVFVCLLICLYFTDRSSNCQTHTHDPRYPLNGAPIPINGEATPWPRGCVSHCESVCASTPGCTGFTLHSDKPPNMASCQLKNCSTDFELASGFEYFQRFPNGTFGSAGPLAPPQALPGMTPPVDPNACSLTYASNGSIMLPEQCPLRYSCRGDCKQDPTGPHSSPDCDGVCLAPPPPPPPPPPVAHCNTTNSTNECPGGMVCPSCPRKPCTCPPWPPVAPWIVLPQCLSACQKICSNSSSCAGLLFSRTQVDGQQCSFSNCSNLTVQTKHDSNQWIAFAKNASDSTGWTEHDWTTCVCTCARASSLHWHLLTCTFWLGAMISSSYKSTHKDKALPDFVHLKHGLPLWHLLAILNNHVLASGHTLASLYTRGYPWRTSPSPFGHRIFTTDVLSQSHGT